MSITNMIGSIKDLYKDYVVLIKIGNFYEVYNDDASIISYLFKYKIKTLTSGDTTCGFPVTAINKVMFLLDKKCINYVMIDKANNYEEEYKMNYKRKNTYDDILVIAKDNIDKLNRIEKIKEYLIKNESKIEEVEKCL